MEEAFTQGFRRADFDRRKEPDNLKLISSAEGFFKIEGKKGYASYSLVSYASIFIKNRKSDNVKEEIFRVERWQM